jgi:hypothetical protein
VCGVCPATVKVTSAYSLNVILQDGRGRSCGVLRGDDVANLAPRPHRTVLCVCATPLWRTAGFQGHLKLQSPFQGRLISGLCRQGVSAISFGCDYVIACLLYYHVIAWNRHEALVSLSSFLPFCSFFPDFFIFFLHFPLFFLPALRPYFFIFVYSSFLPYFRNVISFMIPYFIFPISLSPFSFILFLPCISQFLIIPLYLQSVPVRSANCVKTRCDE